MKLHYNATSSVHKLKQFYSVKVKASKSFTLRKGTRLSYGYGKWYHAIKDYEMLVNNEYKVLIEEINK